MKGRVYMKNTDTYKEVATFELPNAIVRIHGTPNLEGLKTATERFMKKVLIQRKTQSAKG